MPARLGPLKAFRSTLVTPLARGRRRC